MTLDEFNKKWEKYLLKGAYGLDINQKDVIHYIDKEFEKEININPNFKYSQIKMKFGICRAYVRSFKKDEWENEVDRLMN